MLAYSGDCLGGCLGVFGEVFRVVSRCKEKDVKTLLYCFQKIAIVAAVVKLSNLFPIRLSDTMNCRKNTEKCGKCAKPILQCFVRPAIFFRKI